MLLKQRRNSSEDRFNLCVIFSLRDSAKTLLRETAGQNIFMAILANRCVK